MDPVKSQNAEATAQQLAELLEMHVRVLAETIGERNVNHPQALTPGKQTFAALHNSRACSAASQEHNRSTMCT
jgi:hypothetical protein